MKESEQMARARAACPCQISYGIAFACPATMLPRMGEKLVIQGPCEPIPYLMPVSFECPRHIIMGW